MSKYRWDTNIHWRAERRGSKTLAEMVDGKSMVRIVFDGDDHGYRIYEDHIPVASGKIHHRENGLESSMLRAEEIYDDYKAKRDAK